MGCNAQMDEWANYLMANYGVTDEEWCNFSASSRATMKRLSDIVFKANMSIRDIFMVSVYQNETYALIKVTYKREKFPIFDYAVGVMIYDDVIGVQFKLAML